MCMFYPQSWAGSSTLERFIATESPLTCEGKWQPWRTRSEKLLHALLFGACLSTPALFHPTSLNLPFAQGFYLQSCWLMSSCNRSVGTSRVFGHVLGDVSVMTGEGFKG